jgi:tripeptidyl-peptidase-2
MMTFPLVDLVPKKETNVLDFLQEHPEYDGRNVIVGILDTGIDPGAHGIRYMSDGVTPKLIDIVDCSGSGDVDMSTLVEATWVDGGEGEGSKGGFWKAQGLKRTLKLSSDWNMLPFPESKENEATSEKHEEKTEKTVQIRIGLGRAYDLFPASLVARVKKERGKIFSEHVDLFVAKVRADLADWKEQCGKKPTQEQIRTRDDLQARLDVLLASKEWDDPGPLYDCVVFYDGQDFRAVIDVNETGDLCNYKPITSFSKEFQFGTFGTADQL